MTSLGHSVTLAAKCQNIIFRLQSIRAEEEPGLVYTLGDVTLNILSSAKKNCLLYLNIMISFYVKSEVVRIRISQPAPAALHDKGSFRVFMEQVQVLVMWLPEPGPGYR